MDRRILSAVMLLTAPFVLAGCDSDMGATPESHWTAIELHPGEIGEYLPDGLPEGTPLGYTTDYLECRRGTRVICLYVHNLRIPAGLQIGQKFEFTRPLDEIPQWDMAYGMAVYHATDGDIRLLEPKVVEQSNDPKPPN